MIDTEQKKSCIFSSNVGAYDELKKRLSAGPDRGDHSQNVTDPPSRGAVQETQIAPTVKVDHSHPQHWTNILAELQVTLLLA